MESLKNYIEKELFMSLSSDENVNEIFDITCWDNISSLYFKYKGNEKDGYIITTCPYFHNDEICFKIMIVAVDSCKEPKPWLTKYLDKTEDTTNIIKNYLTLFGQIV